jgi:hypothetical protein
MSKAKLVYGMVPYHYTTHCNRFVDVLTRNTVWYVCCNEGYGNRYPAVVYGRVWWLVVM